MLKRAPIVLAAVIAIATVGLATPCAALTPSADLELKGPWAYTQRLDEATNTIQYMAATPAAEDADVWLLLVCSGTRRVTASLMHISQFPYALKFPARITLRSGEFPVVTVAAGVVQPNQLSIDPAVTRHLMPLLIDGDRVVASISDNDGIVHDYTFSVQPNDLARDGVALRCSSGEP